MSLPHRKIVLHIEDDMDDQVMLEEAVKAIDPSITIRKAKTGQEGLELLLQSRLLKETPSIIILDINLPGMDGKQVLLEIRKNKSLDSIPVVLFTTSSSELDKLFAEKQNAAFITKPSSESEFKIAVEKILQLYSKGITKLSE